jgi:hypothetical protein
MEPSLRASTLQQRRKHRVRCSTRSAHSILTTVVVQVRSPRRPAQARSKATERPRRRVSVSRDNWPSNPLQRRIHRLVKLQSAWPRYLASYSSPVGDKSRVTYTVVSDVVDRWRPCKPVPGVCLRDYARSRISSRKGRPVWDFFFLF